MAIRIALFEIRYHLSRVSTYVSFALLAVANLLLVSVEYVNSPLSLADLNADITTFSLIIISAIAGMAVCRDFEEGTYQLFFVTPITRSAYLAGRLLGSLVVVAIILIAIPLGQMLGAVVPWHHEDILPFRLWGFVQPFLLITAPAIWFGGAWFFAAGALSRRVSVVYLQGVGLLSLYLVAEQLLQRDSKAYWPGVLDPMGQAAIARVTDGWTASDRLIRAVPLTGVMAVNRAVWLAAGLLAVVAVMWRFPRSVEGMARRPARKNAEVPPAERTGQSVRWRAHSVPASTWRTRASQWWTLTRLRAWMIARDPVFGAITVLMATVLVVLAWDRTPVAIGDLVATAPFLLTTDAGFSIATIVTAMYAGELVWRERILGFDLIHEATPIPTALDAVSRLTALAGVQAGLVGLSILAGLGLAALQGHSWFELRFYIADILSNQALPLVSYAIGAMFLHTVLPNRFLGHLAVIVVVVATTFFGLVFREIGARVPVNLYDFGSVSVPAFAGLNGYDLGRSPAAWFWMYWLGFGGVLLAGVLLFARRGRERGWRARTRHARARWTVRHAAAIAVAASVWIVAGARIYARAQPHRPAAGATLRDTLPDNTRALFFEPSVWNGSVIIDAFGGLQTDNLRTLLVQRGFAVATPALAGGYWALADKQERLDTLRSDISLRYGAAAPVYLYGHSEGAYRVLAALEQHPDDYRGGVAFCAFTPVDFALPDPALELLVAFDHTFPGLLSTSDTTLANIAAWSESLDDRVHQALGSEPTKMRDLAARFDLDTADLEETVWFFARIVREFQDMALGNPLDVMTHPFARMAGVPDFSSTVRRFPADPAALARAKARFGPLTGRLAKPALIVENAYDPILPPQTIAPYVGRVTASGSSGNLVTTDVTGRGHCNFTLGEEVDAIDRLIGWVSGGAKPAPGRMTSPSVPAPSFPPLPASTLDGRWRLTAIVNNGMWSPNLSPAARRQVWVIREGVMTAEPQFGLRPDPKGLAVTDSATSPNHSDEYDLVGQRWKMIHEIRGDEFIQAYFLDDSRALVERPRSFVEPGLQVRVFKRVTER